MNNLALVSNHRIETRSAPARIHLRASDLQKSYRLGEREVQALRGISFDLAYGEFVALCGSSGSGKSTLLNILGCLDTPSIGEIQIGERSIRGLSDRELAAFRARELGFVFQTFNLLPVLSAIENVEYPMLKLNLPRQERQARAEAALARVGLAHHANHRPDQLSGGQRQRVAIARAIVHRPQMLIADEPTASLDKRTAGEILDLLGELNRDLGLTIIVATHDPLVMKRARRQLHITDGVIGHAEG